MNIILIIVCFSKDSISFENFETKLDEIQSQLQKAGIIHTNVPIIEAMQTFLPRVYPMYRRGWLTQWRNALEEVSALGSVFPIGRQGLFLHCNIDHCVHIANEAVQHLIEGGTASTWTKQVDRFLDLRVRD